MTEGRWCGDRAGTRRTCVFLSHAGNRMLKLVGAPRFELGTSASRTRRAAKLRYAPTESRAACDAGGAQ